MPNWMPSLAAGPPLNLPRRQARTTVWVRAQAPGSYLWDAQMLAQFQVVDPRMAKEPGTPLRQQLGGGGAGRLHHRVQMLALHLPGRHRRGDRTEHDDARPVAKLLVVGEHLVVQRQLEGTRDELRKAVRHDLMLAAAHEADGEDLLGTVVNGDVEGCVVDDTAVQVFTRADPHRRKQAWNRSRR